MSEFNTTVAVIALIQTFVGGLVTWGTLVIRSMKADMTQRLVRIEDQVLKINSRVDACERSDARDSQWKEGHSDLVNRCSKRFDTIESELRDVRQRWSRSKSS